MVVPLQAWKRINYKQTYTGTFSASFYRKACWTSLTCFGSSPSRYVAERARKKWCIPVLYTYLDERDNRTEDTQEYRPNGFTEESVFSDFPVRDKKYVLHVRRRRWLTPEGKSVIMNVYPLAAADTRYSAEFAAFFKESLGYDPGDSMLPW